MIEEFNDFPWHDAELREIIIDRVNSDIVSVSVVWPDDIAKDKCTHIEFFDCYAFRSEMNFGMYGPDSLMEATCVNNSEELDTLRSIWKEMRIDLHDVHCFRFETISTGSVFKIFAKGYRVVNKQ